GETLVCESFEDGKRASGIVVDENSDKVFVKIAPTRTWPVPRSRIRGTTWVNDAADYPKIGDDPNFDRVARGIKKPRAPAGAGAQAPTPASDPGSEPPGAPPAPAPAPSPTAATTPAPVAPGAANPAAPRPPEPTDDALVDEELCIDASRVRDAAS